MSNESLIEFQSIFNNIIQNSITIYQRGGEQRKKLQEFFVGFGIEMDTLNSDTRRIIKNIYSMNKKECLQEIQK